MFQEKTYSLYWCILAFLQVNLKTRWHEVVFFELMKENHIVPWIVAYPLMGDISLVLEFKVLTFPLQATYCLCDPFQNPQLSCNHFSHLPQVLFDPLLSVKQSPDSLVVGRLLLHYTSSWFWIQLSFSYTGCYPRLENCAQLFYP